MYHSTSRPLILTVATLALLGVQAMTSPSAARASQAGTSIPPVYMQMVNAMTSAQSYKLVSDSTVNGGASTRITIVSVRHGNLFLRYMATDTTIGAKHMIGQLVFTGTHVCYRQSSAGAWNCRMPATTVASYAAASSMDPRTLAALGVHMSIQMAPAGSKVVQGQMCMGYSITSTTTSSYTITTHGTYWRNTATGRPVEMDTAGAYSLGSTKNTIASKVVWSNWNDPTLTIPTVPAS